MAEFNKLSSEEERLLIEKAKTDKEAFGELYEIYFSQIFDYILRRTANVDLTEDITSQVFMKVLENIQKYEWRGLPFSAWLYRIASNMLMTYYRQTKYIAPTNLDDIEFLIRDENSTQEEVMIEQEDYEERVAKYEKIRKALFELKDEYAEIITLKYLEEKDNSEIAELLNITEGNLRVKLFRAIRKIKNIIND